MITEKTYGADKNILIAPELAHTVSCIVGNTGLTADANGKKIIKAGTPVGHTTNALENRQTVLVVSNNANTGKYVKTTDTALDNAKTYYTLSGTTYSAVAAVALDVADIGTYYELVTAEKDGKSSQGLVLHDVDVTNGNENTTLIVAGVVDTDKIDVTINAAAKAVLTKIIFQKGGNR